MAWDPAVYLSYADERRRPAVDLFQRVDTAAPARVVDLGCGHGELTAWAAARWPEAEVIGVDNSPEMLAEAAARGGARVRFVEADAAAWSEPCDVLLSNAALHWLPDHEALVPRLFSTVRPGGAFAVQVPRNFAAPSHEVLRDVAAHGPWAPLLEGAFSAAVLVPEAYHRLLRPLAARVEVWETEYLHALTGDDPVLRWVEGSVLRPVYARFADAPEQKAPFRAACAAGLARAYPRDPDGVTLFPFRRLFFVATRR